MQVALPLTARLGTEKCQHSLPSYTPLLGSTAALFFSTAVGYTRRIQIYFGRNVMLNIYNMTVPQMINRGWTIINDKKRIVPLPSDRSLVIGTNSLGLSSTYYRGKYRFDESGTLEIRLLELHSANKIAIMDFSRDLFQDKYVTPDGSLAGSNERLRRILGQSRVDLDRSRYDDAALVHVGPDGTFIYTNEAGWGPPCHWPGDEFYFELDDLHTCYWEIGPAWTPEAPCWTCPECNGF